MLLDGFEAEVFEGSAKGNPEDVSEGTLDRDPEGTFDGVMKGPAEGIFSLRRSELRGKSGC